MRTKDDVSNFICMIFEVLAEQKMKNEDDVMRAKIDKETIAILSKNVEV